ncbi:hypothetical protein ABZ671_30300 [Micromonospora sp. NPDC006766]|uniref:AbiTii domain-containing protein n=1 Tax=Micromonospora sp. NPDC006766 TaxID=3154778 RepID=UPI0033DBE344
MGLVEELVAEATNSKVPVQDLLRKLKVIAARTRTKELGDWVDHELSGYRDDVKLPAYRGPFQSQVYGHFSGPFGSGFQNAPIPSVAFPKEYRELLFSVSFYQPVAELEEMARSDKTLRSEWPADALMLTQMLMREGKLSLDGRLVLNQAYRPIPTSVVAGVLDSVRSRILDLALTLEDVAPTAGEKNGPNVSSERMNQIFHNHIYGAPGNIAIGSTNVQQTAILPSRGDEEALIRALLAAKLDPSLVNDLRAALAEDRADNNGVNPSEPGPRVSRWWSRFALSAVSGAGAVGSGAAGDLVAQALGSYFGIGP